MKLCATRTWGNWFHSPQWLIWDDLWLHPLHAPGSEEWTTLKNGWAPLSPIWTDFSDFSWIYLTEPWGSWGKIQKDPKGKSLSRWMSTATHGSLLLSRVLRVPVPHFYGISANWSRAERLSGWFLDANPLEDWDMSLKNVLKASLWWEMMMFMFFPLSNLKMMSTFWEGFWCTLSYCINA